MIHHISKHGIFAGKNFFPMRLGAKLSVAVGLLLLGWLVASWAAPPLHLAVGPRQAVVHVETLGEYQTTITRIRLTDLDSKQVVWETVAKDSLAQLHKFTLKLGDNPTALMAASGAYSVILPAGSERFVLRQGISYKIEVWDGTTFLSKSSAIFMVGN